MTTTSLAEKADALEHQMIDELESVIPTKSVLYMLADGKREFDNGMKAKEKHPNAHMLMGQDPRLPRMPERPQLLDFFKYRFAPSNHLLQSATHALKAGMSEKTILACLLHDIAVTGFIRCDHGYWGAQLIEPYVDEEVSWAIRAHQALRFFPDESVGYPYPEQYIKHFGREYVPDEYIQRDYQAARNHKWYMNARMITVHDIYSFDPNAKVSFEPFIDIVGRHFRQPEEGLGNDSSPAAHMWRTIRRPTKYL